MSRSRSGAPTSGPRPVHGPWPGRLCSSGKWPSARRGPWPECLCSSGKWPSARRGKLRTGTAILPLLHTPPRLVPTPETLAERQHGTVVQVKTAVLNGYLRRGPTPSGGLSCNPKRTKGGLGWALQTRLLILCLKRGTVRHQRRALVPRLPDAHAATGARERKQP